MKKIMIAGLLMSSFILFGCTTEKPGDLDAFAQCLTDAGVKMYGTDTCPYCLKQKAMFADSFTKVNFVNCQETPTECSIQNIQWIPAWIFSDGSRLQWLQDLEKIAEKTGCELPKEDAEVATEEDTK